MSSSSGETTNASERSTPPTSRGLPARPARCRKSPADTCGCAVQLARALSVPYERGLPASSTGKACRVSSSKRAGLGSGCRRRSSSRRWRLLHLQHPRPSHRACPRAWPRALMPRHHPSQSPTASLSRQERARPQAPRPTARATPPCPPGFRLRATGRAAATRSPVQTGPAPSRPRPCWLPGAQRHRRHGTPGRAPGRTRQELQRGRKAPQGGLSHGSRSAHGLLA